MPKQATKSSKTSKKCDTSVRSSLCHPSTWLIILLAIAFITVIGISAYSMKMFDAKSDLDYARLAVFNDLAETYIMEHDITDNGISEVYQMTGYGISDEDGAFYITFDFVDPADISVSQDGNEATISNIHHGIMYFWKDAERGTYSHAYSYHDDDYRPAGTYVHLGE